MDTKQKILDSAYRLFSEKGELISVSDISKEVGIRKATLYSHFESKERILFEVFKREIDSYFNFISERTANIKSRETKEIIRCIYFNILEYFKTRDKVLFWKRIYLLSPGSYDQKTRIMLDSLFFKRMEYFQRVFDEGIKNKEIKKIDVRHLQYAYFVIIHGVLATILISGYEEVKPSFEAIWEIFWDGIKA